MRKRTVFYRNKRKKLDVKIPPIPRIMGYKMRIPQFTWIGGSPQVEYQVNSPYIPYPTLDIFGFLRILDSKWRMPWEKLDG